MSLWMLAASAVLLSPERIVYVLIWRAPDAFARACRAIFPDGVDPVNVLAGLFVSFKLLQFAVFGAWCLFHGDGLRPASTAAGVTGAGIALLALGQVLNFSVFARLGRAGVFYGNRLGRHIEWREGFPFSWFRHPQYLGTVMSIWGFFVLMRYPAPDWMALPLLETLYYIVGAYCEENRPVERVVRASADVGAGADGRTRASLRAGAGDATAADRPAAGGLR
jgi:methylene-fatty-acyl-phospholipid synthase